MLLVYGHWLVVDLMDLLFLPIDFYTFSSNADAADFGDLTRSSNQIAACSSSTRGLFAGGNPEADTIDYVTMQQQGMQLILVI